MAFGNRALLNLVAAAVGIDPANEANHSVLEQKVLFNLKNATAVAGTDATGTLTTSGTFSNNETVTIGDVVYTFKTTLSTAPAVANEVLIGGSASISLDNLKEAVNKTGTEGTNYGFGTKANKWVTAGTKTATTLQFTARSKRWGNSVATTETCANASFGGATLSGGAPNVVTPPAAAVQAVSGGHSFVV